MTAAELQRLVGAGEVEINLRVRARVIAVHDSHGLCAELRFEKRAFAPYPLSRSVWADADEIVEVQP